jgi:2-oxoglutarate dehydrogenase E1 component
VDTLLLCSGRITWDLMVERAKREDAGRFAIARVEQLYPRPIEELAAEAARYPGLRHVRWIQDEPENMGPWPHYALNTWRELGWDAEGVTRQASSSPSVGTVKRHTEEQRDLIVRAFAPLPGRGREDY